MPATLYRILACSIAIFLTSQTLLAQDQAPVFDPNVNGGQFNGGQFNSGQTGNFVLPNQGQTNSGGAASTGAIGTGQGAQLIDPNAPKVPNTFPEAINEPMTSWMDWSEWDSSLELGINGGSGNSESFNVTSGFDFTRSTELTETKVGLKYINNKSNNVLVAHNARLNIDWEKKFGDMSANGFSPSRWSWFIKNNYYYDDFRPFDLRIALNSGLGYKFFDNDVQMFKGRFGAGVSREFGGVNDDWIPEALFGLDYRRQLSKAQKLELTVDYFPSWEDYTDYRVVTDCSWVFLIDDETNLSLKLNVNDQYDSTPDGAKANDIFYSILMLWKF